MSLTKTPKSGCSIIRYLRRSQDSSLLWQLKSKSVCASTEEELSKWLIKNPFNGNEHRAVFAAKQLYGKGQRGKDWFSPRGGVWVSAAMPFEKKNNPSPELLGMAFALALSERLESHNIQVKIKWPNDLIVENKKIAGLLPRLIYRGNTILFARVGLGLNITNNVPKEAISISQILKRCDSNLDFWSAEVLLSFEKAMELISSPKSLCKDVESRFWSKEINYSGLNWDIDGLSIDGALRISNGSKLELLRRWN